MTMTMTIDSTPAINIFDLRTARILLWTEHIQNIYKITSQKLYLLYKTRPYFLEFKLLIIYKCHPAQMDHRGKDGNVALRFQDIIQNRTFTPYPGFKGNLFSTKKRCWFIIVVLSLSSHIVFRGA